MNEPTSHNLGVYTTYAVVARVRSPFFPLRQKNHNMKHKLANWKRGSGSVCEESEGKIRELTLCAAAKIGEDR